MCSVFCRMCCWSLPASCLFCVQHADVPGFADSLFIHFKLFCGTEADHDVHLVWKNAFSWEKAFLVPDVQAISEFTFPCWISRKQAINWHLYHIACHAVSNWHRGQNVQLGLAAPVDTVQHARCSRLSALASVALNLHSAFNQVIFLDKREICCT